MTSSLLLCVLLVTVLTATSAPLYTDVVEEVPEIKILLNDDILDDGYDLLHEDLVEKNIHKRSLEGLKRGNLLGRSLDSLGGGNLLKRSLEGVGSGNLLGRSLDRFHEDDTLDGLGNGNLLGRMKRSLDGLGGGNLLKKRSLDGLGGGNLLGIFFDGVQSKDRIKRSLDGLGNGNLLGLKRSQPSKFFWRRLMF